jgi:hypothetical protein
MLAHIYEYVRTVGRPEARGNAARLSSPFFCKARDGSRVSNPFDPRSPEGLIYQFRDKHCCRMSYLSCAPGSNVDMIKHDSFTLPFDTFLRSVSGFKSVRDHFLNDGPHVYVRQFLDAFLPDDREKAKLRSFIADAMLSETTNAMGVAHSRHLCESARCGRRFGC